MVCWTLLGLRNLSGMGKPAPVVEAENTLVGHKNDSIGIVTSDCLEHIADNSVGKRRV